MSEIILDISEALPEIERALASFRKRQVAPSTTEKDAIRAVWSAVDATRIYISSLGTETPPNRELAELWSNAALNMAAFDSELAHRLRMKAEYWSDPGRWSDEQIQKARIGINTVADEARALLQLAVPKPPAITVGQQRVPHLFLSHASEDKESIVEPLALELKECGLEVWYDKFNLKLGDNLRTELDKALKTCRYGIVILSEHFFAKEWTQMELNALLALETSARRKRILPIRHGLSHEDLVRLSPLLAGRVTMSTDAGVQRLAHNILSAIGPS